MDRRVALWGAVIATSTIFVPWATAAGLMLVAAGDPGYACLLPVLPVLLAADHPAGLFVVCASFTTLLLGAVLADRAGTAGGGAGCLANLLELLAAGMALLLGGQLLLLAFGVV